MGALYENIKFLCDQKGVKPGKMCADIGVSKGLITDLKMGRKKSIRLETASKIAQYFNVSADYLLNHTSDPIDMKRAGFYERFAALCEEKNISPTKASVEIGFSRGSVSYWKKKYSEGVNAGPDSYTAAKIADYFGVSVDYILGRTTDRINYDADGDAQNGTYTRSSRPSRFSAKDAELAFALWGDATDDIDEKDLEDIRQFAAFIKEKKQGKRP